MSYRVNREVRSYSKGSNSSKGSGGLVLVCLARKNEERHDIYAVIMGSFVARIIFALDILTLKIPIVEQRMKGTVE